MLPTATAPRWRRPRLFATRAEEPRSRRATDVILLFGSVGGLALLGAMAVPQPGIARTLAAFVASIPSGLDGLWLLMIGLLIVFAAVLVLAALFRRRWAVLRDLVLGGALAFGVGLLVARIVTGSWPAVWDSLRSAQPAQYLPPLGLAVATAVSLTASPHVSKPARRVGDWLIVLALFGTVLHRTATPTGATIGLLVAAASAAAVHLIFGSCMGRPSLADVASALQRLGVQAHSLGAATRQAAGVFVVDGLDDSGRQLVVKVYGRDAHDTQLLTTVGRTIWYREAGSPTSFGRLQQAEHEALLTLLAAQAGLRTQQVVMASATPENDVVLVLRRVGRPLAEVPEQWSPALAAQAWQALRRLHDTGITHGAVDDQHVIVDGQQVGLIDFRGAAVSPRPDQLRTDEAQLLVTTALALGNDPAVSAAADALGPDGLTAVLPFVQLTALTAAQRRGSAGARDLDALRSRAAELTEIAVPELQQLRRVTTRSLVQMTLLVAAFVALTKSFAGLDFDLLGKEIRDATWWLVVVAALLAQAPRLTGALSVMGASPTPLALGPVYMLQLATSYISLAVPTAAARVAVNIRFFQRHGLRAGTALAVGALDSVAQFTVQILLLGAILLLTPVTLDLDFGTAAPSGVVIVLLIVIAVGVATGITIALVPKWRRTILGWLRQLATEALETVRGLRSPRRLALLLGGNLATEVLFAVSLQTFVRALGFQVGLAETIFIIVSVSLLSGIMPIPGGIGVVEGGLSFGLVRAGMPEEAAFAAVLLYRLATFYLPPIWGFFALRWLERNKHL